MSNIKKLMMSAAGGDVVNVEDVFSSYLYYGNNTANTITNGLDLATEGGLVWTKRQLNYSYRSDFHHWFDTVRGPSKILYSNMTEVEATDSSVLSSFNSDGFTLGSSSRANQTSEQYASWAFRQHPKFFQIKTFSTTYNTDPSYLTHDLECDLGVAIFKSRDNASQGNNWIVWHKDSPNSYSYFRLNSTASYVTDTSNPISYNAGTKTFTFNYPMTVAGDRMIAGNQATTNFVGYFFAHNNNDGEFGASGDQDIIKCGKYTGNGSYTGPIINLGFEPQFLLVKRVNSSGNWYLIDDLRGFAAKTSSKGNYLYPNTNTPHTTDRDDVQPLGNGFQPTSPWDLNTSGNDYIYIAIRKGMKPPSSASEVFTVLSRTSAAAYQPSYPSGFGPVDFFLERDIATAHDFNLSTRLNPAKRLVTNESYNQANLNGYNLANTPESMLGLPSSSGGADADELAWMWKSAEGFFQKVCYIGTGSAGQSIGHSLGVAPEMIWVKGLDTYNNWAVYNPNGRLQILNQTAAEYSAAVTATNYGNGSSVIAPTATQFTIGASTNVNASTKTYLAFLFATLSGISKVGSYTGNGSSQTINCGFSAGSRFILIKRTDATGEWYLWDTVRGIVAGNDPYLRLNTTIAQQTNTDWVDPNNSGFIVNGTTINASGGNYIFYAIA